jgi:hypothetical protein
MAKCCTCIGAILSQKQSLSHFLDSWSDKSTDNEVEQGELNTGPTNPYQTFVIIQGGHNRQIWQKVALALEPS